MVIILGNPDTITKSINIMGKLNLDPLITTFNGMETFIDAINYAKEKKGIKTVVKM